ncbi:MAG: hemK [Actinomycetia bacterium]|nr:hemK [Actinomycetes bacterium]
MSDTLTWAEVRREAAAQLDGVAAAPESEARWLVEEAAPDLDGPVTTRALAHFDAMLGRRLAGEPLQYVLGHWAFRSLDLLVDPRVLIPRPETEVVAGEAIDELRRLDGRLAVDLGTGSGAIALSMADEVKTVEVWAVDRSTDALAVARANLAGIGRAGARVRMVEGDWFDGLPDELRGTVDVVVSNPPYVADGDELPASVREWEPTTALLAGADGLDDVRRIVADAPAWLRRPGTLVVEVAPTQAEAAVALALEAGFDRAEFRHDMSGRPRFLVARFT